MTVEVEKYYLLKDGTILNVTPYDGDFDFGCEIGGSFTHLNTTDLSFEEAKKLYGDKVFGANYSQHSDYSFYLDNENPEVFFINDVEGFDSSLLQDFEYWFNGYVYDVRFYKFYDDLLEIEDIYLVFGFDYDKEADLIVCDVTKEMELFHNDPSDKETIEFLKAKFAKKLQSKQI